MEGSASFNDRLSSLPDKLLHRVMSFLPAHEAVRTCVLSPRWQHLWESLPCLQVDALEFPNKKAFTNFVNILLLRRGPEPLHSFHLSAFNSIDLIDLSDVDLWIFDVLSMEVKVLYIELDHTRGMHLDPYVFSMPSLKKLHLSQMLLSEDLMRQILCHCKHLESLDITHCRLQTNILSSDSLKQLKMTCTDAHGISVGIFEDLCIKMPSLIYLHLDTNGCRIPLLSDISSVETALISLDGYSLGDDCSIIQSLSSTMQLEILAPEVDVLEGLLGRDLAQCCVFSKLKSLSLDDWCLGVDCSSLIYFLVHSPVLQKLSLVLKKLSLKAFKPLDMPFRCQHLKCLRIEHKEEDVRICSLMRLLRHGAPFLEEITQIKLRTVTATGGVS